MMLIGRRNLLAGLGLGAGSTLLMPMARGLLSEAHGQTPRKRLVIYKGSSQIKDNLLPGGGDGQLWLGEGFAPLEPFRSQILCLRNLHNPIGQHLHGNFNALAVADPAKGGGITLDRLVARELGKGDPKSSINLGLVMGKLATSTGGSADGPNQGYPGQLDPLKAYDEIFGGFTGGMASSGGGTSDLLARRRSLLDFLRADVSRLQTKLAAPERSKLDQYLTSLRGTETQLTALAQLGGSCGKPPRPTVGPTERVAKDEVISAQASLATTALICGITHVAQLFKISASYTFLGDGGKGQPIGTHEFWHGAGLPPGYVKYYQYHATQIAGIRQRLAAVREGNGTMADNTMILVFDEAGGQHHNGYNDIWMMMIGGAGAIRTGGRCLSFPKMERCVSDAFVSIANGLGVPVTAFGEARVNRGPLPLG